MLSMVPIFSLNMTMLGFLMIPGTIFIPSGAKKEMILGKIY